MVVGDVERVRRGATNEGDVRARAAEQAHPVGRQRVITSPIWVVLRGTVQHQGDSGTGGSPKRWKTRWLASA